MATVDSQSQLRVELQMTLEYNYVPVLEFKLSFELNKRVNKLLNCTVAIQLKFLFKSIQIRFSTDVLNHIHLNKKLVMETNVATKEN